jgi:hypothetical protein
MPSRKLTEDEKARVAAWAAEGADLNTIQDRLKTELGVTLTFMETRFLVSDLGLTLASAPEETGGPANTADGDDPGFPNDGTESFVEEDAPRPDGRGGVRVTVDALTLPGSMASGKVTFSDGTRASWSLDQLGRLGLSGVDRTYQPPEDDVIAFQRELQKALRGGGY